MSISLLRLVKLFPRLGARRDVETSTPSDAEKRKREFDVVVEASGAAPGFKLALDLLRPKGKLVLKSTFQGSTEIDAARIVVDEIAIIGSRCGRFEPALDLLEKQKIDVESLISEEFSLTNALAAMDRAGAAGVLKVLLRA